MPSTATSDVSTTLIAAVQTLPQYQQAELLYDIAVKQINAGIFDAQIDNYLDVYLKTPNLSKEDAARGLLTRAKARKMAGERAILMANQDFLALEKLEPTNRELQVHFRSRATLHRSPYDLPSQRAPLEVWERIASFIPRYHLRTWLFLSHFYHSIAIRFIFHTVDIYLSSDDQENLNRGLDFFDRVKADPTFASHIKSLRLHWAVEEGETLDLMIRIFRSALPDFRRLKEFEWIGYPELKPDVISCILKTHSHLQSLGMMGWHFDASGIPSFRNLRKFTLRAEDDDGYADMNEIRQTLDVNASSLRHLVLGAYLAREHSWDTTFQSNVLCNLTHLDLVDTKISHFVFVRILSQATRLRSLTLHGTLAEPTSAAIIFKSDYIVDGKHTSLPDLQAFRFIVLGHDADAELYSSVISFVAGRKKLRKLDLGNCPWRMLEGVLSGLTGLRVLGVKLDGVAAIPRLASLLPREMNALHISFAVADATFAAYAMELKDFYSLSFLHFSISSPTSCPIKPKIEGKQDEYRAALKLAVCIPSLDFVGWLGEHYAVVRKKVYPSSSSAACRGEGSKENECTRVELKELPARRQLDCSKGVDLGTDDAMWLERKDVPINYEMPSNGL